MKLKTEKLNDLQRIAEKQKREMAKIEGRIDSLMEDLKEEGYDSVDSAAEALRKLNRKLSSRTTIFDRKLKEFSDKYDSIIQKSS